MYDVTKMISTLKGKRGDHRIFRLAENLCMNLILSMRDFFFVKREGKVGKHVFQAALYVIAVARYKFSNTFKAIAGSNRLY